MFGYRAARIRDGVCTSLSVRQWVLHDGRAVLGINHIGYRAIATGDVKHMSSGMDVFALFVEPGEISSRPIRTALLRTFAVRTVKECPGLTVLRHAPRQIECV